MRPYRLGVLAMTQCSPDPGRETAHPGPRAVVHWRDAEGGIAPGHLSYTRFTSLRTGRSHLTRSPRDRQLMLHVDTLIDVRDACLHPAVVHFFVRGVERQAEPWLWVRRPSRDEFWCTWNSADHAQGASGALREQLAPLRIALVDIDPERLLSPCRVEVAALLRRHCRHPVDPLTRELARRLLGADGAPVLFQDVLRGTHPGLSAATVCRLIFDGAARLVPSDRLRPDTRVVFVEPQQP